jgi:uncharacterized protein (TIGR01777 family)
VKVVIPGGSGQVGTILGRSFHARGDEVVVLSRSPSSAPWRVVGWDAASPGEWADEIEGADVVVNLTGRSVDCRYNAANRDSMMRSRVIPTRLIAKAIAASAHPPRVWLQASTATIYAHRYDAPNDEATGIIGGEEPDAPKTWRFSIEVARSWESAADETALPETRLVKLRSAMIMSPDRGGVFDTLLALVRRGLGSRSGDGRQYVSWSHDVDFIRAVDWILDRDRLSGAVNVSARNPCPMRSSCAIFVARGVRASAFPRRHGCSRLARSS